MSQATAVDDRDGQDDGDDADQEEFAVFFARQGPAIEQRARVLAAMTGLDPHVLVAHTVDVLYRSWGGLGSPRSRTGRAFARTVMANRIRDLHKSAPVRREELCDDVGALAGGLAAAGGPEDEVIRREERTRILDAVRALPDLERAVIALRYEEHSFPAIAALLGTAFEDVRNAALRARRTLRGRLTEDDDES